MVTRDDDHQKYDLHHHHAGDQLGSLPHRDTAVLAHEALENTHTEHPAALGPKRR